MVRELSIYEELGEERKLLQENGSLPHWCTTAAWQMLKENYLSNKYTDLKSVYSRIAKHAATYTNDPATWELKFFDLLWNGWLAASTPVLSNMGTGIGCPVSCSGGFISDSVYSFYESQKEAAVLSKNGFGTSGYLGDIRPRGSKISGIKGSSSGVLPVFKDFVQMSRDISQGSQRRGAWAGYIEIDHPDFHELVNYINKQPDDANIGWNISNDFIKRLDDGDKDAIERYQKALKLKMITGKGYFEFIDKVNEQNPAMYKDLGLTVKASNLCFSGDTLVAVADGRNAVSIEQLAIESNGVGRFPVYSSRWNSNKKIWVNEIKPAIAFKTGEKKLIKVTLSDGSSFKCTPDHAIALKDGTYIEASLSIGKPLQPFYTSLGNTRKYRHINSMSNGHAKQHSLIWRYNYGDVPDGFHIDHIENNADDSIENLQLLEASEHRLKTSIEVSGKNNAAFKIRDEEAYLANKSISMTLSGNSRYLGLTNIEIYEYAKSLYDIGAAITFGNLGKLDSRMPSSFSKNRFGGSIVNLRWMVTNNIEPEEYIKKDYVEPNHKLQFSVTSLCVTKIEYVGIESVYDLTVEDNHNFNIITSTQDQNYLECSGILVHNCSEIQLFSDDEHTFSCVLSSMNASLFDEWKNTTAVFDATVFLDCVNQDLIEIGKNTRGMEKVVRFAEKSRALGLGLLGFHTYLQDNNIAFESFEAQLKNTEIFKHINEESLKASQWMASQFGEPEWCKGYGVRNTHRIAVAPNLSSALICGSVSQGIEPIYKNAYVQNTAAGKIDRVNPTLLKLMKERGVYSDDTVKDIINKKGSVQHVEWLDDHEKLVFKTAFEIDQMHIIRLASSRQRYIDQAQSINLFFSSDETEQYISEVHKMAFKDPYIKSLYYIRSESGVQTNKGECVACHG
jgi:ribonucleotide reductase alpha subunit